MNCDAVPMVARNDYVANVGNPNSSSFPSGVDPLNCVAPPLSYCECNAGPPSLAAAVNWPNWVHPEAYNGVSFSQNTIAPRQITDGLTYTAMVGEKIHEPQHL